MPPLVTPRPARRAASFLASACAVFFFAGCFAGPVLHDNTGDARQLSFGGTGDILAVAHPFTMGVARLTDGYAACAGLREGNCVASGGDTPLAFVEAHCDDGLCSVQDASDSDGVVMRVEGLRAGAGKLHVRMRDKNGSQTWDDTKELRFAVPDGLVWRRTSSTPYPVHDAGFPGTTFATCVALEAGGIALGVPADELDRAVSVSSDVARFSLDKLISTGTTSIVRERCGSVTLEKPGNALLEATLDGLSARVKLKVADPKDVVSLEIVNPRKDLRANGLLDEDPLGEAAPVNGIPLTLHARATFVVAARLADGSRALGGAGFVTSEDKTTLLAGPDSTTAEGEEWRASLFHLIPLQAGTTAFLVRAGAQHLRVPVTITAAEQ